MEKLKFALLSVVTLSLIGILGFWSVSSLQSGTEHLADQKIKDLTKENDDLTAQVAALSNQLGDLQAKAQAPAPAAPSVAAPAPIVYKYQDLMDALQKLIDNKVTLKQKSAGANVGAVQKFLNIYNNTSSKIDNDYGAAVVKLVTAFQKDSGLAANGQASSGTFSKMISWLQTQM